MVKTKKPGTRIIALCHIIIVEIVKVRDTSLINQYLDAVNPAKQSKCNAEKL